MHKKTTTWIRKMCSDTLTASHSLWNDSDVKLAAIERNLEADEQERVSADMRIRKSQVQISSIRSLYITHQHCKHHNLIISSFMFLRLTWVFNLYNSHQSLCSLSMPCSPGSLWRLWPSTTRPKWTSGRGAKDESRGSWRSVSWLAALCSCKNNVGFFLVF